LSLRVDYLITLVTAVELGSFAKAARKLEITEGGVSHHMRALERYFGAKLFIKTVKGPELSEEGKIVFRVAKDILDQLESARRRINDMKEVLRGTVKIEASTIPGEHVLPHLISDRGVHNLNLAVCTLLFVVSGLGLHPALLLMGVLMAP